MIRLFVFLSMVITTLFLVFRYAPTHNNVRSPFKITSPMGTATHSQLLKLAERPEYCFRQLDLVGIEYRRLEPNETETACSVSNGLVLLGTNYQSVQDLSLTCPQMAALHVWQNRILQPASRKYFKTDVAIIKTLGSFSCRRVVGAEKKEWSQHAFGNAIDIAGFVLSDGTEISVLDDWETQKRRTKKAKFLGRVFDESCRVFSVALGPDFNAAHKDHFHFDLGPERLCE